MTLQRGKQVHATLIILNTRLPDGDGDGVPDDIDNCPSTPNSEQNLCTRDGGHDTRDGGHDTRDGGHDTRDGGHDGPIDMPSRVETAIIDGPTAQDLLLVKDAPAIDTCPQTGPVTKKILQAVNHQQPGVIATYNNSGGIEVTDLSCAVTATVSGLGSPQIEVNGAKVWAEHQVVHNGDRVRLRLTTASDAGKTHQATLHIGNATYSWRVTTCTAATCMTGSINANASCSSHSLRVWRWKCPGSNEWIYAREFTYQFKSTGLLDCPSGATCDMQACGANSWQTHNLACPQSSSNTRLIVSSPGTWPISPPSGCTTATFKAWGAGGGGNGRSGTSSAGAGGFASRQVSNLKGTLLVHVGAPGANATQGQGGAGGTPGGGRGGDHKNFGGGGGGGMSYVTQAGQILIVAGAGGGPGTDSAPAGGGGQDAEAASNDKAQGGKAGTQGKGEEGGESYGCSADGENGRSLAGGDGAIQGNSLWGPFPGGGGGAGYFGGGGGGCSGSGSGAGGGGGSSYAPNGSVINANHATPGNPKDPDRGSAGNPGQPGSVVIIWK